MRRMIRDEAGTNVEQVEVASGDDLEATVLPNLIQGTPMVITDRNEPIYALVPIRQGRLKSEVIEDWLAGRYGVIPECR